MHYACCCAANGKGKFDEVVDSKGVQVIIDPRAIMHHIGTTMDYVEEQLRCVALHAPSLSLACLAR